MYNICIYFIYSTCTDNACVRNGCSKRQRAKPRRAFNIATTRPSVEDEDPDPSPDPPMQLLPCPPSLLPSSRHARPWAIR